VNLDPQIWDKVSSSGLSELQNHYDPLERVLQRLPTRLPLDHLHQGGPDRLRGPLGS